MSNRGGRLLPWLSVALATGGLSTSIAYYFGWVYLREQYAQYGTSPTVVGYNRPEIVFRSLSVFVPAAVGWLVGAFFLATAYIACERAFVRIRGTMRQAEHRIAGSTALLSACAATVLFLGRPNFSRTEQGRASERWLLLVGLTCVLALVAIKGYSELQRGWLTDEVRLAIKRRVRLAQAFILVVFATAGGFVVRSVATDAGLRAACELELNKHLLGEASVLSSEDLGINAITLGIPAKRFAELGPEDAAPTDGRPYRRALGSEGPFEYGGLRVLTKAGDRFWAFPALGTPRNGLVGIALEDIDTLATHRSEPVAIEPTPMCARLL